MDAFNKLEQFLLKNMGNIGATRGIMNTPSDITVEDTELRHITKGHEEEAARTVRDHGFDPDSPEGQAKIKEVLEAIARKKSDQGVQKTLELADFLEKVAGSGAYIDPERGSHKYAGNEPECAGFAWNTIKEELGEEYGGDVRADMGPDWEKGASNKSTDTAVYNYYQRLFDYCMGGYRGAQPTFEGGADDDDKKKEKAVQLMLSKGMSPALANLLAAAAGWALSSDVASKEIPSHMSQEWERTLSRKEKERLQEEMLRKLGKKVRKSDDGNFLDELELIYKDHAPIPPRQGLMFDAVKHRWTRPEKIGRTVWEVQGHKRFRGTGTGAHERGRAQKGHGGYGAGSTEAGRRFKSTGDVSRQHTTETHHPKEKPLASHKRRRRKTHAQKST